MEENKLDVRKAFDAIAKIMGERVNMDIIVKEVKKKEEDKQTA